MGKGLGTENMISFIFMKIFGVGRKYSLMFETFLKATPSQGWKNEVSNKRVLRDGCCNLLHWLDYVFLYSIPYCCVCNDYINF